MKILLLIFLIIISFVNPAQSQVMKVSCQEDDNSPYQIGQGQFIDWRKPGITLELLKMTFAKLHIDVQFDRVPWQRGLIELRNGNIDALIDASYSEDRLQNGVYPTTKDGKVDSSKKTCSLAYVLYAHKNTIIQWDGTKFTNWNDYIGAPRGFSIVNDLKKLGIKVQEVDSTFQLMEMLLKDRFKVIATLEFPGDMYLEKFTNKGDDIVKINPPLVIKDYYLMISHQFFKKNPKISEDIWNTLAEIRESKEFSEIIIKYFE